MEPTRQMVAVSEELFALRGESRRVAAVLRVHGSALGSQAKESAALDLDAQAARLQSQLDYVQAADEMDAATHGRTWSDSPADAAMTFGSHAILAHQDGVFPLSGATHRGKRH